jgi:signal transduction histidine kinase
MVPVTASPKVDSLDLSESHAPVVRLALIGGIVASLCFVLAWLVTSEPIALMISSGSLLWAATAYLMIRFGRENGPVILVLGAIQVSIFGAVSDMYVIEEYASISVILTGVALVLFIRGGAGWFLATYAVAILGVHFLWQGSTAEALTLGGVAALGFIAGALGLRWIRDRSLDSGSRFLNLFERAPVSLWEEDYSGVGVWLDELRAQGVTDLRAHLTLHPEVLREGMSHIEVIRVNHAAAAFLEVDDPAVLVGPLKIETFPDDTLPSMLAQFEAIWNGVDHVSVEVRRGYTLQGNPLDGLLHWAVPRRFGKPDLSRVIVSVVDVTAMNDARRELERSLKSKDELIATVSHELRTPLTTVVGLSSELSAAYDEFTKAEAQDLLRMVAEQSIEVATIVEDLLVAARAESGSLKVSSEPVDLHLEAKTTLRGLEIEEEVDCHTMGIVSTVMADSGRVRQVMRNLLVNARRYGTSPIRVIVRDAGDYVRVEVRDRGDAIPIDERQAIFDRYYRSRQTPGVTASVGLGLTVSRELAHIMGGKLTYEHDGSESVFALTLPQAIVDPVVVAS